MCFKDNVMPYQPIKKIPSVKWLTFEENVWEPYNDNICLWELWRWIRMEMKDSRKEFLLYLIYSSKKLMGLMFQFSRWLYVGYCSSGKFCSSRHIIVRYWSCRQWLGSLRGGVLGNTLLLYGYYVIIIIFVMFLLLTPSSKPIAVYCTIISSIRLVIWSDYRPLAEKKLKMFFLMCIDCEKQCLTN